MRSKKLIFLVILLFSSLLVAVYTRHLDIDRFFRFYDPPLRVSHIVQGGLSSQTYQVINGACILQDWLFRVGSTKEPLLKMQTNLRSDGILIIKDGLGREFQLGKAVVDPLHNLTQVHEVAIDPSDQAIFQVSRSVIPYYYGWRILSSAPLFRYFRYYALSIRQADGATLRAEWKFSTYRMSTGEWVPDHYGWKGEGLIKLDLQTKG